MKIENRRLFLRYAFPCAQILVERGKISQEFSEQIEYNLKNDKYLSKEMENIFEIAKSTCTILAKKMNKKAIDKEVIRYYFLVEHEKVVEETYHYFRDFDPKECKVKCGEVLESNENKALVKTENGAREYKTDFYHDFKIGDYVVIHYGYVVDSLPRDRLNDYLEREPIL